MRIKTLQNKKLDQELQFLDDDSTDSRLIDEEIPQSAQPRKSYRAAVIWSLVALVTAGIGIGGMALINNLPELIASSARGFGESTTFTDEEESPKEETPTEPETPPITETPAPEPEKPAPEPPKEEIPAIAPRPTQPEITPNVDPNVSKVIALTFDDGPSVATTPRLLDILKGRNVHATFFVLGTLAQRSPDIIRREAAEGHEVGSHTPYHNQLTKLSAAQVRAEALEMDRIFTDILGTVPPFTRPPYGSQNAVVGQALGQPMILWSIDPRDWADRNANVVCSRVVAAARDGAIILSHDIHSTTVDAVPCIIDTLRSQGYEFLTISELAAYRGIKLTSGQAYYSF